MNLITKYKLFENKELDIKGINDLSKNDLLQLINNYLLGNNYFNYFKSNGINISKDIDISFVKNENYFELVINFDELKNSYYTNYFSISASKHKNTDVGELKIYLKISYNNYTIFKKSIEIDFLKIGDNIYNNIKDFFINSNREILSTPFIGTKKDVDNLEQLMMLLIDSKKYPVYVSKDGVQKLKEINNNPNYTHVLPNELKFLEKIKYLSYYFSDKDSIIFLYAKFDHGTELIQIHEQYANNVYKMYKKISNK